MLLGRKTKKGREEEGKKASNEGEEVAIVVPPRSEQIFLLWSARAISWCCPFVCSCSGC